MKIEGEGVGVFGEVREEAIMGHGGWNERQKLRMLRVLREMLAGGERMLWRGD